MAVNLPNQSRLQIYTSVGEDEFDYNFYLAQETDLVVKVDGVTKTRGTHYDINGGGIGNVSGGTITFAPLYVPTAGSIITLKGETVLERDAIFGIGAEITSSGYETDSTRNMTIMQELKRDIDRTPRLPDTLTYDQILYLPTPLDGSVLGWSGSDGLGQLVNITTIGDINSAAAAAAAALASAEAAQDSEEAAEAAAAVLEQEYGYNVNPRRAPFNAAGDGVTNDYAAFAAAIAATPVGGVMKVTRGTYVIGGTTALNINKSMTLDMSDGAVLKFTDPNAKFLQITGNDVRVIKPTVIGNNPLVRTNYPGIWVLGGAQRVFIDAPKVMTVPGGGVLTENCTDVIINCPYVKDTLADGVHITNGGPGSGPSKNVKVISPVCINTGDDSVAVVSYNTGNAICENIVVTDLLSINSATSGCTIAGGKNVRMTGVAITPQGPWGTRFERDTSFSSFGNTDLHVEVQVYNADGAGCLIGKNNTDSYFKVMVDGTGITDVNFNRGISLGAQGSTDLVERCKFNFQITNTASHGIEANGLKNCTFEEVIISKAQGHGFVTTNNVSNLNFGTIIALNNGLSAPGNLHNLNFVNLNGAVIGDILSVDDQVSPSVSAALRFENTTADVAAMRLIINGASVKPVFSGTNTVGLPKQVLGDNMTAYMPLSELHGAKAGFFVEQLPKGGTGVYGDGTDDSVAINAAITLASNAAGVGGYCVVKLQARAYYIANPIIMKKGVYLEGQDWWSTRLIAMNTLTSQVINCNDTNCHNFAIRRMRVDGNRANATSMTRGIEINRSVAGDEFDAHGIVEEVMIQNCNQEGIYLGVNARECRINNIQTRYNRRGMLVEGTDNWFTNITANYNDLEGIQHKGGSNHFSLCKAWLNGANPNNVGGAVKLPNWSLIGYSSTLAQYNKNTTFVGCTSQDSYGDGFYIQYATGLEFRGCTVDRASIIDNGNTTTGSKVYKGVHISDSRSIIGDFWIFERAYQGYGTYTMEKGIRFNRLDQCDLHIRTEDVEVPYGFDNMSTERGNVLMVNGKVLDINGVGYNPVKQFGEVLQSKTFSVTGVVTCNVATPLDNTVPQSSEMVEVTNLSFTPLYANSSLRVTCYASGYTSSAQQVIAGIFRDATAGAFAVSMAGSTSAAGMVQAIVTGTSAAGSTAATTFSFRIGIGDASGGKAFYVNGGNAGGALFGGIDRARITIEEIKA